MTMEHDSRPMVAVPPPQRPVRRRRASRIVVRAAGQVLLIADSDPGITGSAWWVTPGGGVDGDETWRDAAARELFEETGLQVDAADLVGPVARRVVQHGYSDQVLVQEEHFFVLDLPAAFEPDTAGHTAAEQATLSGFGWFAAVELATMTVWPRQLAELLDPAADDRTVDWGVMEESTVAVSLGHR